MSSTQLSTLAVLIRSCEKESPTPREGELSGTVPSWLEGSLLRDGPGLFQVGDSEYTHWWDGLSLVHRFDIARGGKITYQNRFLRSNTYESNMKANRIVVSEFGTNSLPDPCATLFQRFRSKFSISQTATDNGNVNVLEFGDGVYVTTETNIITRIDPKTLETKERVDLKSVFAVNTSTAHPHYASDGAMINMGTCLKPNAEYCVVSFPNEGENSLQKGTVLCRIPSSRSLYPSYYHSFGMSEHYIIFVEQPLVVSVPKLAWGMVAGATYGDAISWAPQQLVRFHLVRRSTGELLPNHFVASPFLVFHHVNAFDSEDGSQVVVDMCTYKDDTIMKSFFLNDARNKRNTMDALKEIGGQTMRFVLPLNTVTNQQVTDKVNLVTLAGTSATATPKEDGTVFCQPENLTKGLLVFEMPQMNYEFFNGKNYRYVYGVGRAPDQKDVPGLAKVDVEKRSHLMWRSPGHLPSEPVFVPRPQATEEDDGVLLSSLLSESDEQEVSLVILDARTMKELARSKFQCPSAVPSDLHGKFLRK